MVLVVYTEEALLLLLYFDKVALPPDDVVLVLLVEYYLSVHEILNHILATAVCQEVTPLRSNVHALCVVVNQRVVIEVVRGSHVHVEPTPN